MKPETRFSVFYTVIGGILLLIGLRSTVELGDRGSIAICRIGIQAAEYTGLPAILVICSYYALGVWLFIVGVRRWLAKRKADSAPRDNRKS